MQFGVVIPLANWIKKNKKYLFRGENPACKKFEIKLQNIKKNL